MTKNGKKNNLKKKSKQKIGKQFKTFKNQNPMSYLTSKIGPQQPSSKHEILKYILTIIMYSLHVPEESKCLFGF